jgi:hypothetical protein
VAVTILFREAVFISFIPVCFPLFHLQSIFRFRVIPCIIRSRGSVVDVMIRLPTGRLRYFQSRYVQEVLILSEVSRPDLRSIQPLIKWALLLTAEFAVDLVSVLPWGKIDRPFFVTSSLVLQLRINSVEILSRFLFMR